MMEKEQERGRGWERRRVEIVGLTDWKFIRRSGEGGRGRHRKI